MFFLTTGTVPLFLGAFVYSGIRLFRFLKQFFPGIKKLVFWLLYSLLPALFLAGIWLPVSVFDKIITNIGFAYMGFLIIAIMLLAAAELVRAFLHIIRKLPEKGAK
ncbi:MAG TPA: hypothetical protein DD733_03955, partial [Clostridiales bacterium]|nr:hypothetical protein [Clostridiales bacterium]